MKKSNFLLLLALTSIIACSKRPVLYDNAHYRARGENIAEEDIDDCMERAENAGAEEDSKLGESAARAGKGAVAGAASGAVASTIWGGSVGRGVGAGAAAGATSTLIWGLFDNEPDGVFKTYVNRCLREKGYEPLGWK